MKKTRYKIIFSIILLISSFLPYISLSNTNNIPSFEKNFAKHLKDPQKDIHGRVETVYDICVSSEKTLWKNIKILFYPNTGPIDDECNTSSNGILWNTMRIIGFGILFLFIAVTGINLLMNLDNEEEVKKFGKSFLYILYGAFLFFGATWILGSVLNIEFLGGSEELVKNLQGGQDSLFFQILSFFKALAFFAGIIILIYYGFKIMGSMDQEEKLKNAKKGILNLIIALVIIKVIDYIYFIAQAPDFIHKASNLIIEISKILGYILGGVFVLFIFYAGFMFLTGAGKEETISKAKNIFITIFISAIVIFLFLLILYQIFNEFAPAIPDAENISLLLKIPKPT